MAQIPMDTTMLKRDRLLRRTARAVAGAGLLASFLIASSPDTVGTMAYWIVLPFYVSAAALIVQLESRHSLVMLVGAWLLELAIVLLLAGVPHVVPPSSSLAITTLLVASMSGLSIVLLVSWRGAIAYWVLAGIAAVVGALTLPPSDTWLPPAALCLVGWVVMHVTGQLVTSSIPIVLRQVADIGAAHRAERQASELETQRRHSARLLHDTVLATLTLLAHSGVGVSADALRNQARNDAHLLQQLRLGEPTFSLPDAEYAPEPVEESTMGTTLETVRERFEHLALSVQWHGSTRVLLPQHVLDAFLFAMSECLENVRRHSGMKNAHVTITEDASMVRAMITDAGRGFTLEAIAEQRLGLKDSVMGRLAEVGGSARVFSAPGAGTTVLLEVPR